MLFSDKDECSVGVCSQDCTNSDGSYQCHCYTGYLLDNDKVSCKRMYKVHYNLMLIVVFSCVTVYLRKYYIKEADI